MLLTRFFKHRCLTLILAGSLVQATFAHNVSAVLGGSLRKVFGDNAAKSIMISRTSAGDVVVSGRGGIKVNVASVRVRLLQLNSTETRMQGGDDSFTLDGVATANDLYINLGDRLNNTGAISFVADLFSIGSKAGSNRVRVDGPSALSMLENSNWGLD